MQNYKIRMATKNDSEILINSNILMAKETENISLDENTVKNGVEFLLSNPGFGFYLIAESNGRAAGSLMITKEWSDWRNGFFYWIQSVYVMPEFRRQGVYRALYDEIKSIAKQDNTCKGYRLYVEKNNQAAIRTYENLGMEETYYKLFEEIK